jgi:hypothetical protein
MPVNIYTTLDDPFAITGTLGLGTLAQGINSSGEIVGYYTDAGFRAHGFIAIIAGVIRRQTGFARTRRNWSRCRPTLSCHPAHHRGGVATGYPRCADRVRAGRENQRDRFRRDGYPHTVLACSTTVPPNVPSGRHTRMRLPRFTKYPPLGVGPASGFAKYSRLGVFSVR